MQGNRDHEIFLVWLSFWFKDGRVQLIHTFGPGSNVSAAAEWTDNEFGADNPGHSLVIWVYHNQFVEIVMLHTFTCRYQCWAQRLTELKVSELKQNVMCIQVTEQNGRGGKNWGKFPAKFHYKKNFIYILLNCTFILPNLYWI